MSMFSEEQLNEMELQLDGVGCAKHRARASGYVIGCLKAAVRKLSFSHLAVTTMENVSVRTTDMKDVMIELRSQGRVRFELEGAQRKPDSKTQISLIL